MALYCLCDSELTKYESATLSSSEVKHPTRVTMSVLQRPMPCIKTGVEQYLTEIDRATLQQSKRRHFPNVDIFECPECGTRIAKES
jgi:hypothetical protein